MMNVIPGKSHKKEWLLDMNTLWQLIMALLIPVLVAALELFSR
jgi:hypothetical protein